MTFSLPLPAQTAQEEFLRHIFVRDQMAEWSKHPLIMEKADGVLYWDIHGKRYLDGIAGIYTVAVGHNNRRVIDAIRQQLDVLHFSPPMHGTNPVAVQLANLLASMKNDAGRVTVPPVGELLFPRDNGELHIKYGTIDGDDIAVIKVATGFCDNPVQGLPPFGGLNLVMSARTGLPLAVVLGKPRKVQVTAISHCTLLTLEETHFLALLRRNDPLLDAIQHSADRRGVKVDLREVTADPAVRRKAGWWQRQAAATKKPQG
jgi:hypothetical protein